MITRRDLIEHWYEWNTRAERREYDRDRRQPDGRGLTFSGTTISNASGSERLARFERRETTLFVHADGRGTRHRWGNRHGLRPEGDDQTLPPLVRLLLPNILTIGRHRAISRVVRQAGGMVVTVPGGVLDAADIIPHTIIVIDTEKKPRPTRAPQQLIRARVSPRWNDHERWSYFLSGYDLNEPGLSYFFCELPPDVHPTTIEEAYQALKPQSVKVAEAQGKKVKRQGDIFLIPVDTPPGGEGPLLRMRKVGPWNGDYILSTNHVAQQRLRVDGLTYVRGRIVHAPSGRSPDHITLRLGSQWHLAVKNTVPVVGHVY